MSPIARQFSRVQEILGGVSPLRRGLPGEEAGQSGIDLTAEQVAAIEGLGEEAFDQAGPPPLLTNGAMRLSNGDTALTLAPAMPLVQTQPEMPSHYDIIPGPLGTIVNGVPISGPGVPEPPQELIAKHWHVKFQSEKYGTFQMFYWRLHDGRCMSYHSPTKTWKIWRPKKHIVISRDPRVSTLRKLGRLNKRVDKMLKPFQPKPARTFPARQLARRYLSTAERKLLEAGGS